MRKNLINIVLFFAIFTYGCSSDKYLKDLNSENIEVRNNAIYYLGENKERRAVHTLIKFLNNDQPKQTRLRAIEALGKIGDSNSVEPLVTLLTEKDKEIRIAAIESLGKIKDPKAIPSLLNVLQEEDIQLYVIRVLGNIGDKSAVPALTLLLDDKNEHVRYNAAQSLKKIGAEE